MLGFDVTEPVVWAPAPAAAALTAAELRRSCRLEIRAGSFLFVIQICPSSLDSDVIIPPARCPADYLMNSLTEIHVPITSITDLWGRTLDLALKTSAPVSRRPGQDLPLSFAIVLC